MVQLEETDFVVFHSLKIASIDRPYKDSNLKQYTIFKRQAHHLKTKTLNKTQKVLTHEKAYDHIPTKEPTIIGKPYEQ